ncbi:hypothetical protein [Carboxylicivirga taeanensis]|uniref:hypothetical protein n=1 Tax=Carboxylicivirga taeanensis TaxID=1416875 RepID=UPI003F6DC42D
MKTTVNNNHRHSVINYLFFGIAASIFTLSIFFSLYQQEEKVKFSNELSFITNSRLSKPASAASITETYAVNLKELMSDTEAPLVVEPWMTQPYPAVSTAKASTIPSTYTESPIEVEDWMTDLNSWNAISVNNAFEEEALTIESWMLNTNDWAVFSETGPYASNTFDDEQLYIEAWMLDLSSWAVVFDNASYAEQPLTIESWMLDLSDWTNTDK